VLTTGRPWVWIYALAAVVMTIAIGVFAWLAVESRQDAGASQSHRAGPIPVERFQLLAQFEPPPYSRDARRASHTRQFDAAMEHYLKSDFAAAIPGLRASVAAQSDGPEAPFYLGICWLLTADATAGMRSLQSVVDSGGTSYLEQSRYYLAKGLLAKGDVPGARAELESVIAMHGDLEKQSKALFAQIVGNAAK
jgi:TolA-binding protein